jgi:hypothetical protein
MSWWRTGNQATRQPGDQVIREQATWSIIGYLKLGAWKDPFKSAGDLIFELKKRTMPVRIKSGEQKVEKKGQEINICRRFLFIFLGFGKENWFFLSEVLAGMARDLFLIYSSGTNPGEEE